MNLYIINKGMNMRVAQYMINFVLFLRICKILHAGSLKVEALEILSFI